MCFAPQRRALFSTSEFQKVVRDRQFLTLLTWKCASRHNGVQFFISHLASWLRTRRFSEPTFRPSGATNHWKNTVFRDFPTFSRICIFCPLTLSLLILLTSAFQLSILSEVSLLNFLRIVANALIHQGFVLLWQWAQPWQLGLAGGATFPREAGGPIRAVGLATFGSFSLGGAFFSQHDIPIPSSKIQDALRYLWIFWDIKIGQLVRGALYFFIYFDIFGLILNICWFLSFGQGAQGVVRLSSGSGWK